MWSIRLSKKKDQKKRDKILNNKLVKQAIITLVTMWQIEQNHNELSSYKQDTDSADYTGMIWTSHRPSDDQCKYNYHIPDNFFIHQVINYVLQFATYWNNRTMYNILKTMQKEC